MQSKIGEEISYTKFRIVDVNLVHAALQDVICCEYHGKVDFI